MSWNPIVPLGHDPKAEAVKQNINNKISIFKQSKNNQNDHHFFQMILFHFLSSLNTKDNENAKTKTPHLDDDGLVTPLCFLISVVEGVPATRLLFFKKKIGNCFGFSLIGESKDFRIMSESKMCLNDFSALDYLEFGEFKFKELNAFCFFYTRLQCFFGSPEVLLFHKLLSVRSISGGMQKNLIMFLLSAFDIGVKLIFWKLEIFSISIFTY